MFYVYQKYMSVVCEFLSIFMWLQIVKMNEWQSYNRRVNYIGLYAPPWYI